MSKRNRNYDKEEILADWKTGKFSVRKLAEKHRVSSTTVHGIVAGVDKSLEPLINAEVSIKQELANLSEQERNTFEREVNERTKHIQFFADITVKNLAVMAGKINNETSVAEHKLAQEAILRGKETVVGKEPSTAIQINNQNSHQTAINISDDDLLRIATTGR